MKEHRKSLSKKLHLINNFLFNVAVNMFENERKDSSGTCDCFINKV